MPREISSTNDLTNGEHTKRGRQMARDADRDPAKAALQLNPQRPSDALRVLFEGSTDALFVACADASNQFHLEDFNPAFARLFRIGSRAQGDRLDELLPAPVARRLAGALRRCRRSGAPARLPLSQTVEGGVIHCEFLLTPITGFANRVERIAGHGRVQRSDPAPRGEEDRLRDCIARTTRDLLYVFDPAGKQKVFLNERVHDVLGYTPDEIRRMTTEAVRARIHPDDLPRVIAHYRKLAALAPGIVITIDYRMRHADGHYVFLASKDTILSSGRHGSVAKFVGCITDTSDQRHALAEVRKVSRQLMRTQDVERRRIARELHDSTCQHLVAAGIDLARMRAINADQPDANLGREDVQEILADAGRSINEAQHEIRTLSYLLHPPAFERMGLAETLRRFAAGFARRTKIRVDVAIEEGLVCRSRDIATTLLRIAQEALLNVHRHAGATQATIRLMSTDDRLTLEIQDDGKGIGQIEGDLDDSETLGVGIPGMRARVRQFRGELQIVSRPGGALVRAIIPDRSHKDAGMRVI